MKEFCARGVRVKGDIEIENASYLQGIQFLIRHFSSFIHGNGYFEQVPSASAEKNGENEPTEIKECLVGCPALLLSAVVEHEFNDDGLQGV